MRILTKPDGLHWRDFEHLCLVLFERHFEAADANFYGTRETGQYGIDIRLTTRKGGVPATVVVQCKVRQSLTWSDFSADFDTALNTFARAALAQGRDLRFIVATTAEGVNQHKIDAHAQKQIVRLGMADIASRIHLDVYTWPRLVSMIESDPILDDLFFRPEREADKTGTQSLSQLVTRLTERVREKRLGMAYQALSHYVRTQQPIDVNKYKWAPSTLFDPLADLFLAAGDFANADNLLDAALGAKPLNARYLLGYLRAQRVLHAARRSNRRPVNAFELPAAAPPVAEHVREMRRQLLTALGTADDQLTLALWVVSYADSQELAEEGLRRALNLVTLAWPETVERLAADVVYVLSPQGYLDRESATPEARMAPSDEHMRACALAAGYSYIRGIHGARFGADSFLRIEQKHDGWPLAIRKVAGSNHFNFFSTMNALCTSAMKTYLPALYAEGSGREFDWMPSDGMTAPGPAPRAGAYVTTPEFLLRDCVMKLVDRRIDELSRAGVMGQPATILISHLGLERLVRAHLGFSTEFATQGMLAGTAGQVADGIAAVLARLIRYEAVRNPRLDDTQPFGSLPCYANYGPTQSGDTLEASLHLSRTEHGPFIATTPGEYQLAIDSLPPYAKRYLYWVPAPVPMEITSIAGHF